MTLFKLIIIAKFESSGTGNRMVLYFDNRTGTSSYLKVQPDRTDSNRCFPDYCVCFLWNFRVPHLFFRISGTSTASLLPFTIEASGRTKRNLQAHIKPSIKENKRCPGAGGGEREHHDGGDNRGGNGGDDGGGDNGDDGGDGKQKLNL